MQIVLEMENIFMKKKLISLFAIICALSLLGGCKGAKISNEYLSIKMYKGLEVEKVEAIEVTDEDVQGSIDMELEGFATYTDVTDRPAQMGDVTNIDFVGKKDGEAFNGGTAEGHELELGSNSFIDGFEEGIVGHNIGETFDLNLTFPKEYHSADLAGQAVVFTVTLNGIQAKHVPELTDDILSELGTKATTVAEYKEQVRKDLEQSNKEEAEARTTSNLWEALVEQCEVKKYPDGIVDSYVAQLEEEYYYYAYINNMEPAEFIEAAYQMPVEELAKLQITKSLAISLIAEKESLTISDKEYEKSLEAYAEQEGYSSAEECETAKGADGLRQLFLENKVAEFLMESCVFVEAKTEE